MAVAALLVAGQPLAADERPPLRPQFLRFLTEAVMANAPSKSMLPAVNSSGAEVVPVKAT